MFLSYFVIIITEQLTLSVDLIRHQPFTLNDPSWPCVYMAQLRRYGLSKVAQTDARTLRWFYTLSNAMHCIRQTTSWHTIIDFSLQTYSRLSTS